MTVAHRHCEACGISRTGCAGEAAEPHWRPYVGTEVVVAALADYAASAAAFPCSFAGSIAPARRWGTGSRPGFAWCRWRPIWTACAGAWKTFARPLPSSALDDET